MGREERIAHSVVLAIIPPADVKRQSLVRRFVAALSALFAFWQLCLYRVSPDVFADLRQDKWELDDNDYTHSFQRSEGGQEEDTLHSIGDMGFSGSVGFEFSCTQRSHLSLINNLRPSMQQTTSAFWSNPYRGRQNTPSSGTTCWSRTHLTSPHTLSHCSYVYATSSPQGPR
jgi:hypothetical protein